MISNYTKVYNNTKNKFKRIENEGFTLIELLVVIGILTILLAITLVAINPSRQFSQANNTQRRSDVNAILSAIHQYGADNNGDLTALGLGTTLPATNIDAAGVADMCAPLVPVYLAEMPVDPQTGSFTDCATYDTQYSVSVGSSNRVTISAPDAELGEVIDVTR